jgi:hypothetical protein
VIKGRRLLAFALLPTLAACGWWMAGRPTGGVATRVNFDHPLHVEDMGLTCEECHAVREATTLHQNLIPAEALCLDCHDREAECTSCHTDPANIRPFLAGGSAVAFSHALHVGEQGVDCSTCHATVLSRATDAVHTSPGHTECFSCHEHAQEYAQADCQGCHTSMRRLPLAALAEFDHGGDWLSRHGMLAQSTGAACLQCHTESSCADCHSAVAPTIPARLWPERVAMEQVHRGDFLHSHGIEARADADLCVRCHSDNQFCQDCHTASGITLLSPTRLAVHPSGWMQPSSPNFHGPPARLQIGACASCHDQGAASNCVDCHRVGGLGGNPHPAGFARTDYAGDPMCGICHGR